MILYSYLVSEKTTFRKESFQGIFKQTWAQLKAVKNSVQKTHFSNANIYVFLGCQEEPTAAFRLGLTELNSIEELRFLSLY